MLRSDLCDFSDAYIIVKGTATVTGTSNNSRKNRPLAFKNNASFISWLRCCSAHVKIDWIQ